MKKSLILCLLLLIGQNLWSANYKFYRKVQLNSGIIFDMDQDPETGLYWIVTETGVYTFNGIEFNKMDVVPKGKSIIAILICDGKQFLATKDGLIIERDLKTEKSKQYEPDKNLKFYEIRSISFLKNKSNFNTNIVMNDTHYFKISYHGSIYKLNQIPDGAMTNQLHLYKSATESITSLNYFISKNGTFFYNKDHLHLLSNNNPLQIIDNNNSFTSIMVDADENLILTNYSGNIFIYKNDDISEFYTFSENIRRVYNIDNTSFYFNDEEYNIYKSDKKTTKRVYENTDRRIVDDRMFISPPHIFFNHKCLTNYIENKFQKSTIVFDSLTILGKKVYIGTGYADIKAISDNKVYSIFNDYNDNNNILYSTITDLKLVRDRIYFTTIYGINFIDFSGKRLDKFYPKTRITKGNHTSLLRKVNDQLFFIDNKVDLYTLNSINNEYKLIFHGSDYNISCIYDMEIVGDSLIYLATNIGLLELKLNSDNWTIHSTEVIHFFGNKYIQPTNDVNIFENSIYFTSWNAIYSRKIGQSSHSNQHSGKIIFSISNSNLQYDKATQSYSITGNDRNIKLKYFIPTFNVLYTYNNIKALLIKDGDTIETQFPEGNFINFDNLSVGDYRIVFFYRDYHNRYVFSKFFNIQIIPFYFETTYFRMLLLSLTLFVIVLIIGFFNMRLKNRLMSFENENYNMKLLKAQLRPHFLYNTLNTLKSIVYHQKNDMALELIDKFTLFLRHNLSVDNELISTLQDEIKEIENYIEIENFRTNNIIELNVNIQNLGDYKIPSNIIQPIVENAILHGMRGSEKLHIEIEVEESRKSFTLFIRNDGKPLDEKRHSYQSYAIESIKTRLDIFNKKKIKESIVLRNIIKDNKTQVEYIVKIRKNKHENPHH